MRSLDIHNYILMGFNINDVFYEKFWAYTIIFWWDSILKKFLCEVLDIHNYILMGFNINEVFMRGFGHTQLYSNGILY